MRVLGLDLGTRSVKAVEIEAAFGRYEIHEYHEEPVTPATSVEAAASRLIQGLAKYPDKIIVSLPDQKTTFRNLTIPSRDRKAIQSAITFELEDELPFAMEDTFFTSATLSQSKKMTHAHIVSTLRKNIAQTLISLEQNGIEPEVLTTESWAYRSLLNRVLGDAHKDQPVSLVHIGHSWSTIYIHYKGAPLTIRRLHWGGKDLTAAIAAYYGVPDEDAEKAKKDKAFIIPPSKKADANHDQLQFSELLCKSLKRLTKEIRQAQLSARSLTGHVPVQTFLSGGTSLIPGLVGYIAEETSAPCKNLQALTAVSHSGVPYSELTDANFALAAGLGLCAVGPDRSVLINLRKYEFAKRSQGMQLDLESLKKPALGFLAVLTCFLISAGFQNISYDSKGEKMEPQLRNAMTGVFGYLSSSAARNFLVDPQRLQSRVQTQLQSERQKASLFQKNKRSPINFIAKLSQSIPSEIKVDLTELEVGATEREPFETGLPHTATVTFLIQDKNAGARLKQIMETLLSDVKASELEEAAPTPDGDQRWKIAFSGQTQEHAYEF